MAEEREGKSSRALSIYSRLMNGRTIFKTEERIIESAIKMGVKILVLGAFGCGDSNNDSMIVASAYKDLMLSYAQYFKLVEFAVYCTDKDKRNYNIFNTIIRLS